MTARPTGPQPMTMATSPFLTSPRRTACRPTAIGSVSVASSVDMAAGTVMASASSTTISSAYAPGACTEKPTVCTSSPRLISGNATTRSPIFDRSRL